MPGASNTAGTPDRTSETEPRFTQRTVSDHETHEPHEKKTGNASPPDPFVLFVSFAVENRTQ
jgi:hypothetical protein